MKSHSIARLSAMFATTLIACGSGAGFPAAAEPMATPNVAGTYTHNLQVEGVDREFIVYVPELASGSTPAPVVLMLHGTSGDGERFYNISGWREKADQVGLIAVFPSALTYCLKEDENKDGDFDDPGERKVTTKWASGKLGDPSRMPLCSTAEIAALGSQQRALADHPLMDDVYFFEAILDFLSEKYTVDTKRIYASGFSNGGGMTSRLAAQISDRFAACAAAAGTLALSPSPAARPMPFVFTLGEKDDRFTTPLGVAALPLDESVLDVAGVPQIIGAYLTTLQLSDAYAHEALNVGGSTVSRFTFATGVAGNTNNLEVAIIGNLGHQYPNGSNHPITMANYLWSFFQKHSLP